eukprot:14625055-Alexandrium_andersonii.AAC.1
MVMVRRPTSAQARSPELSRCPFCADVRAEREYSNESLPIASEGSLLAVDRAGRGGGIDNAGDGRRKRHVARTQHSLWR